jgi:peptidoglycan/xylan/chitin deacetylase (PgdA/CDA1 family)
MFSFISLMYHNIITNGVSYPELSPSVTSYFINQLTFAAQLSELCRLTQCIDLSILRAYYYPLPDNQLCHSQQSCPRVLITFDDGWLGAVDVAGPILEYYSCSALLFVTTDLVGNPHFVSQRMLQNLPKHVYHVGSHAKTHRMLNLMNEPDIHDELQYSKSFLEDTLGYEVDTLSIPGGAVDERIQNIAASLGYRFLFTSEILINTTHINPMQLGRIAVRATTTIRHFRRYLQHNVQREQRRRQIIRMAKHLLGPKFYEQLRCQLLGEERHQYDMIDLSKITSSSKM